MDKKKRGLFLKRLARFFSEVILGKTGNTLLARVKSGFSSFFLGTKGNSISAPFQKDRKKKVELEIEEDSSIIGGLN